MWLRPGGLASSLPATGAPGPAVADSDTSAIVSPPSIAAGVWKSKDTAIGGPLPTPSPAKAALKSSNTCAGAAESSPSTRSNASKLSCLAASATFARGVAPNATCAEPFAASARSSGPTRTSRLSSEAACKSAFRIARGPPGHRRAGGAADLSSERRRAGITDSRDARRRSRVRQIQNAVELGPRKTPVGLDRRLQTQLAAFDGAGREMERLPSRRRVQKPLRSL